MGKPGYAGLFLYACPDPDNRNNRHTARTPTTSTTGTSGVVTVVTVVTVVRIAKTCVVLRANEGEKYST